MSLISIWHATRSEIEKKQIKQLVSMAGDGTLKDGGSTSLEVRGYLAEIPTQILRRYLSECLDTPFNDSGLVLQDIVNELGTRLDCVVTHGLYRGRQGEIGFDGIWKFPDGYSLVVEVKTTDAYAINLDTVAKYRKLLIKAGKITEESSILIVVGRKDTHSLEAQVRGSRYGWDMRLISADALLRLVEIKESADSKATINKIRSILAPVELTKLDFVVEILASTAQDIQEQTTTDEADEAEQKVHAGEKGEKKFTPVAFNDEIAEKAGKHLGLTLKKATRSLYIAADQSTAVRCVASKSYGHGDTIGYWYAFHPHYKEPLNEYKNNFIAFGCGAPEKILLFPLTELVGWLEKMNVTQKDDRMYWHVQYIEDKDGRLRTSFKKGFPPVDVTGNLIKIK